MKAVIIAGGLGTRLRPLTYSVPKPIVPILNRPFLLYQIELLKRYGIDEVILNLHYYEDQIKAVFGDGSRFGVKVYYSIEKEALGTAGAVKNAEEFFTEEEELLVFNGDILVDLDLKRMLNFHREKKADVTLSLMEVEDPTAYGLIFTDKNGRVEKFLEKPTWEQVTVKTVNAGIYVVNPKIFKTIEKGVNTSFERELYPNLLKDGAPIYGIDGKFNYWLDIGTPPKYLKAHHDILEGKIKVKRSGREVLERVFVEEGTEISQAKTFGAIAMGKSCQIADGAEIHSLTVLGDRVKISRGSRISSSVLLDGVKVGEGVEIKGAILGKNCQIKDFSYIGPGTVLADNTILERGTRCA